MADIYLSSVDGDDGDDGSTWALAKATLAAALTAAGAGGTVYMDNAHAESTASGLTLTSPGTAASPTRVLCVDRTGNPEPPTALATTGTVTNSSTTLGISYAGCAYVYGVSFINSGTGAGADQNFNSGLPWWWRLENCGLQITGTNAGQTFTIGNISAPDNQLLELINTPLTFGAVGQLCAIRCPFIWTNTPSAIGGTVPTSLLRPDGNPCGADVVCRGVDLSAAGSGKNLVDVSVTCFGSVRFENCKLGASVSIVTGTHPGQGGPAVDLVNCDSADTNYRYHKHRYQGDITQETTIVRTGGASDGTTPISRKMVTSANSKLYSPLVSDPIIVWNESTAALTVTVEVITDNVTLTDKEAWIEVEYLGTSGFPISSISSDRASANNSYLGSGTNQTTSSETWTTTGLTTPVKQALATTFTPAEKGPLAIRVHLAKESTTMYFCPKVTVA